MHELILIDNDIALKLCAYACAGDLIGLDFGKDRRLAMLRVAQYTIERRVKKAKGIRNGDILREQWSVLSAPMDWVEPTADEIELAAELEEQAIRLSVELDSGESQLFAILVYRVSPLLLTGDKRAIHALESIGRSLPTERIACLEQVIFTLLQKVGVELLHTRICCEPGVDRTLSIVFACHGKRSPDSNASIEEGLTSYVISVQKSAPTMLLRTTDLSAIVS
jgi:hypothetical protein